MPAAPFSRPARPETAAPAAPVPGTPAAPAAGNAPAGRGDNPVAWLDCLWVALAAIAVLAAGALRMDVSPLHVTALNDQVVYVSVARNLAERGVFDGNILYPATLWQGARRSFIQMPGQMLALAASFKLFGFGTLQAMLPSLAAYVASAVCLFWIGARRYGRASGFLASAWLMAVPAQLYFAFTAMAESTLVAAALLALAGFLALPPAWRPVAGPLLLALPFVCRETGALMVLPMIGAVATTPGWDRRRRLAGAGLCLALAVAWLGAIAASPLAAGRPSVLRANLLGATDRYVYYDAAGQRAFAAATAGDLARGVAANVRHNLSILWHGALAWTSLHGEDARARAVSLLWGRAFGKESGLHWTLAMAGMVACLLVGGRRPRDGFALGAAAMALAAMLLVVAVYNVAADRGLRLLLLVLPLGLLGLARAVEMALHPAAPGVEPVLPRRPDGARRPEPPRRWHHPGSWERSWRRLAMAALAVAAMGFGFRDAQRELAVIASMDGWGHGNVRQLERRVRPDDSLALVAPWEISLDYAFWHHPIKWAFLPANRYTLELLARTAPIGTVLLPQPQPDDRVSADDLRRIGLAEVGVVTIRRAPYLLFKRPARP
jgi:4-amino-4-deoxy-L-arabinose transferase-like glycosyltransferase